MKTIQKITLFLSAFIPLYGLLLIKILIEIANSNLRFNVLNTIMVSLLSCFILIGIVGLVYEFKKNTNHKMITLNMCTNMTENYFLGYFSLFVLFALTFNIELIAMSVVFVLISIFVGIVYIKNNLFYINPTLNILGYSLYQVEVTKSGNHETLYLFSRTKLQNNQIVYICGDFVKYVHSLDKPLKSS